MNNYCRSKHKVESPEYQISNEKFNNSFVFPLLLLFQLSCSFLSFLFLFLIFQFLVSNIDVSYVQRLRKSLFHSLFNSLLFQLSSVHSLFTIYLIRNHGLVENFIQMLQFSWQYLKHKTNKIVNNWIWLIFVILKHNPVKLFQFKQKIVFIKFSRGLDEISCALKSLFFRLLELMVLILFEWTNQRVIVIELNIRIHLSHFINFHTNSKNWCDVKQPVSYRWSSRIKVSLLLTLNQKCQNHFEYSLSTNYLLIVNDNIGQLHIIKVINRVHVFVLRCNNRLRKVDELERLLNKLSQEVFIHTIKVKLQSFQDLISHWNHQISCTTINYQLMFKKTVERQKHLVQGYQYKQQITNLR